MNLRTVFFFFLSETYERFWEGPSKLIIGGINLGRGEGLLAFSSFAFFLHLFDTLYWLSTLGKTLL